MTNMILGTAAAGFVLVLIATFVLVVLNWSEKTLAPVLSILLVGWDWKGTSYPPSEIEVCE